MKDFTCLITGANGQVGWELQQPLARLGQVVAVDREELDLLDLDKVRRFVREVKPNVIFNAAAYTAVDQAEVEPEIAHKLNAEVPAVLAQEAKALGAVFVSYSTDYVFDGTAKEPYTEDSLPSPLGVYGRSKLAGDQAIDAVDGAHLIFRTSWVYGTRGKNFYLTMCRLAEEGRTIRVVGDQVGCPTWSRTIAEISSGVVLHAMGNRARSAYERIYEQRGIYNLVSRAHTSWCGFAQAILDGRAIVQPITSDEFPSKARRPAYSVLSTRKLEETFGFRPPLWTEALEEVKLEHAARNEHLIR